jgi:predicted thioredoxin/glutaredoxin
MVDQEELINAIRNDLQNLKNQAGNFIGDISKKAKDMNEKELQKLAFRAGVCNRWEHVMWWLRVRRTWWGGEEAFFDWEGIRAELIHRGY